MLKSLFIYCLILSLQISALAQADRPAPPPKPAQEAKPDFISENQKELRQDLSKKEKQRLKDKIQEVCKGHVPEAKFTVTEVGLPKINQEKICQRIGCVDSSKASTIKDDHGVRHLPGPFIADEACIEKDGPELSKNQNKRMEDAIVEACREILGESPYSLVRVTGPKDTGDQYCMKIGCVPADKASIIKDDKGERRMPGPFMATEACIDKVAANEGSKNSSDRSGQKDGPEKPSKPEKPNQGHVRPQD